MNLVFNQVGQLEHVQITNGHWLVKRIAALAVNQLHLAQGGDGITGLHTHLCGALQQLFVAGVGRNFLPVRFQPQAQCDVYGLAIHHRAFIHIAAVIVKYQHIGGVVSLFLQPLNQHDAARVGLIHRGAIKVILHFLAVLLGLLWQPRRQEGHPRVKVVAQLGRVNFIFLEGFPGALGHLAVCVINQPRPAQFGLNLFFIRAVKHGCHRAETEPVGGPSQVCFQNLADVHTTRHAQRVEDDIYRLAVWQIRHVLYRNHAADHALVAVATGHLVALGQFAALSHAHAHHAVHASGQIAVVVAVKNLDFHDLAVLAVWHTQAGVFYFAALLAKDGAQQFLFWRKLCLALGCDLAHQNVVLLHFRANADDAGLVQIFERFLAHVWNIAGNFFRAQFGLAGFNLVFFNVNAGEHVLAHHLLAHQNGVFVVAALP